MVPERSSACLAAAARGGEQREALGEDLARSAKAEAPQDRHRRTPALQRMLQQERADGRGEKQEPHVHERPENDADEADDRRIGLDRALDVPLARELAEAPGDDFRRGVAIPVGVLFGAQPCALPVTPPITGRTTPVM